MWVWSSKSVLTLTKEVQRWQTKGWVKREKDRFGLCFLFSGSNTLFINIPFPKRFKDSTDLNVFIGKKRASKNRVGPSPTLCTDVFGRHLRNEVGLIRSSLSLTVYRYLMVPNYFKKYRRDWYWERILSGRVDGRNGVVDARVSDKSNKVWRK